MPRAVIIGQAVGAGTSIISPPNESLSFSDDMSTSAMLRNPVHEMGGFTAQPAVRFVAVFFTDSLYLIVEPVEAVPILRPRIFRFLHFPDVRPEYLVTTPNAGFPALNERLYWNQ